MTRWLAGVCTALAALGAARAEPPGAASAEPPVAAAAAPDASRVEPIKEIAIDAHAKEPRCRRSAPTGSRIVQRHCETREQTNEARAAEREQTRRDVEEMRMRQLMRDQARALAGAMRGRGDR